MTSHQEGGPPTFASADEEGDVIHYPCPSCNTHNSSFEWTSTPTVDGFATYDEIFNTDYRTFLGMTVDEEDEVVRVFECINCDQLIGYFPETGSQYVA